MLKNIFNKITAFQKSTKYYLFENQVEKHKLKIYREEKRQVDEEELKQFKFYLFFIYSLFFVIPIIFLFSLI